jgi:plastocyanin
MNLKSIIDEKYEIIGLILLIVILIGVPYLVVSNSPWNNTRENSRIVFLTAVAKDGVWTNEIVTNSNYWNRKFQKANLSFQKNEKVLFRLTSMDVTHTFYVPELNIGPIEVKPGKLYEITHVFSKTGKFVYYCTTVCGNCHFYMQGNIYVNSDNSQEINETFTLDGDITTCGIYNNVSSNDSFIEKGEILFISKGCVTCHGIGGEGGIHNPNYINTYIPQINDLAEKMYIYWEEDANTIISLLEDGEDLEKQLEDPPFRRYNRFYAQYESIMNKILDGASDLQKKNVEGPNPPLYMPSWRNHLTDNEINSIIAYLIVLNDWNN